MELNLVFIGLLFIIIGIILIFSSATKQGNVKVAVGGFIGPIPFGWANDPGMLKFVIILTAIIAVIFFILIIRSIPF